MGEMTEAGHDDVSSLIHNSKFDDYVWRIYQIETNIQDTTDTVLMVEIIMFKVVILGWLIVLEYL